MRRYQIGRVRYHYFIGSALTCQVGDFYRPDLALAGHSSAGRLRPALVPRG